MKRLTVFTPTFNRAHTLPRAYEALKNQSSKDFIWLIIDDGSTDETKELVEKWQDTDNGFEIRYIYKQNGGMHTAHNVAYDVIDTELNVCIDSDDVLAPGAVENILNFWDSHPHESFAGIVALDSDLDGNVIGKPFSPSLYSTTLSGYYKNGGSGDKKLIYRTEIVSRYPRYPEFPGEKLVPLSTLYSMIDKDYELLVMNETVCNVEYQSDGSSNRIFAQYIQSPRGFAYARKLKMKEEKDFPSVFWQSIQYVSSSVFSKNKKFISESPKKLITVMAIPFGLALSVFVKIKGRQ